VAAICPVIYPRAKRARLMGRVASFQGTSQVESSTPWARVHRLRIGDRGAVYQYRGCGRCQQCRTGRLMWYAQRWSCQEGVSASFETSSSASGQHAAVESTGRGGRVAFAGFGSGGPTLSPSQFIQRQLALLGSFVFPIDAYEDIVGFVTMTYIAS
jgi:threonine dehydrogenase-like Zn-dependent dehydrogenase